MKTEMIVGVTSIVGACSLFTIKQEYDGDYRCAVILRSNGRHGVGLNSNPITATRDALNNARMKPARTGTETGRGGTPTARKAPDAD